MRKDKSLKELGEEYLEYEETNEENIRTCREKLRKAKEDGDEHAVYELQKSLSVLYKISNELLDTSKHLVNYYENNSQDGIVCNGGRKE